MPLVQLWDFEDGSTQGWMLVHPNAQLVKSNMLNNTWGVYVSRLQRRATWEEIMRITLDLSTLQNAVLVVPVKIHNKSWGETIDSTSYIKVEIVDADTNVVVKTVQEVLAEGEEYFAGGASRVKVFVFYLGGGLPSNALVKIWLYLNDDYYYYFDFAFDNIALYDGGDDTFVLPTLGWALESSTLSYDLDKDVSTLGKKGLAIAWSSPSNGVVASGILKNIVARVEAVDGALNTVSLSINSGENNNKNITANTIAGNTIATIRSVSVTAEGKGLAGKQTEDNALAVMVFDESLWKVEYLALFVLKWTLNPIDPSSAVIALPGPANTSRSGSVTFKANINCTSFSLTPVARYIEGDSSAVSSGTITVEVYDSAGNLLGSSTIDLTQGTQVTGTAITNLPGNQDLTIKVTANITASSKVTVQLSFQLEITA